jgi:hypothetical protein
MVAADAGVGTSEKPTTPKTLPPAGKPKTASHKNNFRKKSILSSFTTYVRSNPKISDRLIALLTLNILKPWLGHRSAIASVVITENPHYCQGSVPPARRLNFATAQRQLISSGRNLCQKPVFHARSVEYLFPSD